MLRARVQLFGRADEKFVKEASFQERERNIPQIRTVKTKMPSPKRSGQERMRSRSSRMGVETGRILEGQDAGEVPRADVLHYRVVLSIRLGQRGRRFSDGLSTTQLRCHCEFSRELKGWFFNQIGMQGKSNRETSSRTKYAAWQEVQT